MVGPIAVAHSCSSPCGIPLCEQSTSHHDAHLGGFLCWSLTKNAAGNFSECLYVHVFARSVCPGIPWLGQGYVYLHR